MKHVAIDTLSQLGYDIPRFCYHESLKIAGNCRMCSVEGLNAPKPIICCAMEINNDLSIFTDTLRVKKSRESVMEFLLINHPLDCPIRDQGGECDSQDLALVYGSDHGRFYEYDKRTVEDKNCGNVIKTVMNRCILCTRCVRFSNDIANFNGFGVTGRGVKMEIGSYIEKVINSELSGNLVDVCPVGALTSKPYAFLARPWELKSFTALNIFDDFIQELRADVKENTLIRLQPSKNDNKLNNWITNKVRFSYEGLQRSRNIQLTITNVNVSWSKFLTVFKTTIETVLNSLFEDNIAFLSFNLKDVLGLKEIHLINNFSSFIGASYIISSSYVNKNLLDPVLDINNLNDSENKNIVFLGLNPEWDSPILNIAMSTIIFPTFIFFWNSYVSIKNFDIIILQSSISTLKNYLIAKNWLSNFSDKNIFFYNFFLSSFITFFTKIEWVPIYPFGATSRNLSLESKNLTHSQNFFKNFTITSLNINTDFVPGLFSISQNSHLTKFSNFNVPTQTVFEQSDLEVYSSFYEKIKTLKVVVPNILVKSNYSVLSAILSLLGCDSKKPYDQINYTINTVLQVYLKQKNLFNKIFLFTNYIFLPSTRLIYTNKNLITANSLTAVSALRNEEQTNIYNI